ncbi:MAG: alginate O-acetyltransferase AlgX-related protein [Salibacteraceae bacterium]
MKKLVFIFTFFLVEILCVSIYFSRIIDTNTFINFNISSSSVENITVFYDLGYSWSGDYSETFPSKPGQSSFKIKVKANQYPQKIRIDPGMKGGTIAMSNFSITNNLGDTFTFKHLVDQHHVKEIKQIDENNISFISIGNDPYLVFDTHLATNYWRKLHAYNWSFWLISIFISSLGAFFASISLTKFILSKNSVVILFLFVISLAIINQTFQTIPYPSTGENRKLAKAPNTYKPFEFTKQLEEYLNDNFSLRPMFAFIHSTLNYYVFNCSSIPENVIVGQNEYLFPVKLDILKDYKSRVSLTEAQLKSITTGLIERKEWLKKLGIPYLLVLVPNKHTVYPELMSRAIIRGSKPSRLDQLLAYVQHNSDLIIEDLTDELMLAKQTNTTPLYYKRDMHWNNFGAYWGYRKIMDNLSFHYPDLKPYSLTEFDTSSANYDNGDLAQILNLNKFLLKKEVEFDLKMGFTKNQYAFNSTERAGEIWVNIAQKRKLIMFRDSYAVNLVPFISNHFRRSVFIWDQHFDYKLILSEKPDVVVQEVAELFIDHLLFENPVEVQQMEEVQ